ncbi:Zinc finger, BED-type domain containing protein [Parasponia andersonii]|uniref:Zinc finger, BED-type domain containing protein n=1 Tax=Parasponia andersonii TaxID=3476 RepID=A0A2P5BYB6_PARAD|nr:Zinc finger, BED-type domain containing protein [Parasponia andersonii]
MVRGRDACWEHCVLVDANRQKVRCNYCQREFSGGVYRMKFHLAQIKNKDIVPCTEVPIDVRDRILSILSTPKKQKANKKQKVDQAAAAANGREDSSSASGGFHPNHGSSGQNGSICPSLLFPRRSPSAQPVVEDAERQKRDDADKKIAIFFFNNCIPFSAAKSTYYQEMVDAVAECGTGYRAPGYEKLRSSLLEKVKGDIHDCYKKYREEWKETGCTILCDMWSDGRTKSFLVFSVTCPKGTLFLKSVDVSANKDDPNYMFELLESVVLEIGVENVVQVVTDTAASSSSAGRLLMAKYNSLFWSPCASCCIDKILEDIGKLDWVNTVLENAKTITRYIYSHSWTLNMMRKFTGGRELIRPRISRYVSNFLSLRSIVIQEDNLKHMFSHTEWLSSMYSRRPEAQAIKSLLYLDRFWKDAHEAVSVSEPFVKILRIVDGDMPAMGYMYEGIERAKISLKAYYKGVEQNYKPIWDMIERRWNLQVNLSLHAAAAFLNPSIIYNPIFKIDARLRNGFQEAMSRMATTDNDKMELTKEHPAYIGAQGALGTQFAIMGRLLNAPGDWWVGYGYEIPTLQRVAIRILSQPCSSHWCRWNWTTFESLHSKKRNRQELEKLNDLVFVHCNLWLQATCQSRGGKSKPIIFDEIDVSSEWPTELDPSAPLSDDSWLDNLPLDFRSSP